MNCTEFSEKVGHAELAGYVFGIGQQIDSPAAIAGIAAPDDGHALLEADQRFQAALAYRGVEATVQLKRHTKLSL